MSENISKKCRDVAGAASGSEMSVEPSEEMQARLLEVSRNTEMPGYVLMTRRTFFGLCELGKLNCINLYAFLMLVSSCRDIIVGAGHSWWGREKLSKALGLSVKQLRLVTKHLEETHLIFASGSRGASLEYKIRDWETSQDPKTATGYFKLFRSLRDDSRRDLVGNAELFRLWLYILASTRSFEDETTGTPSGSFLLRLTQIEDYLHINREKLRVMMNTLQSTGRISRESGQNEVKVINWDLYQNWMYRPTRRDNSDTGVAKGDL